MAQKYKVKIENSTYEWDSKYISGQEVRGLGPGIPDNMDLFLKVTGKPGRLIGNETSVDLSQRSIQRFYAQQSSSTAGAK